MCIYSNTNYKQNLIKYWRQFNPLYKIPKGFHVHHIIPKLIAKQNGWEDAKINHPKNLIALHPDDHISIHKNRGDKLKNHNYLHLLGLNNSSRVSEYNNRRVIDGTNPFLKRNRKGLLGNEFTSHSSSIANKNRVLNKTHNWLKQNRHKNSKVGCTSEQAKNARRKEVINGTHQWLGLTGIKNYSSIGIYVIDDNKFQSITSIAEFYNISVSNARTLTKYCKNNTSIYKKKSKLLEYVLNSQDYVKHTFKDLGFSFISKEEIIKNPPLRGE